MNFTVVNTDFIVLVFEIALTVKLINYRNKCTELVSKRFFIIKICHYWDLDK